MMTEKLSTPLLHFFRELGFIQSTYNIHFKWPETAPKTIGVRYDRKNFGPAPIWKEGVCDCETEIQVVARMADLAVPLTALKQKEVLVILPEIPEGFESVKETKQEFGLSLYRVNKWMGDHRAYLLEVPGCTPLVIEPNFVTIRERGGYYGVQNNLESIYLPSEEQVNDLLVLVGCKEEEVAAS